MAIQWFPGHMAKARREVSEKLKLVDIIFELLDARIPVSSANPMLDEIIQQKPRIKLLNKADMADPIMTSRWLDKFSGENTSVLAIDAQSGKGLDKMVKLAEQILQPKWERKRAKGIKPRAIRAMIVGIPNVGKSTLINRLAGKNIAKTGNTPGVTKAQAWIKVGKSMELLDTPGILWPKFEDEEVGYKLALTGAIKDTILNLQDVAVFSLRFLEAHYTEALKARYKLDEIPEDIVALFDHIGRLRGCLRAGGEIDYDKTADIIIRDIRGQKLGPLTFDTL
ncbi:ribosome biogenesis GTPase A [Weizmannia acidilactici]|uniref:Ribosome biogenesis GTPase A n=1 Tax=Weizmannia acidilactici TaxID=2607726 RepID=A0A5J4JER2_9BACI|nr:ribosome biogenesis GTPase YlqF [Weizmannia acidilactici]GER65605.1 ribosome biogenesis GTPase A [Weizmannia acidilactici]GER69065.1 ribosome biogenesis GTPase A [Weizmannia acidilactici]GER71962.1 ribosome biogenesis GTPase A [Weizmannia acidilactici]